MPVYTIDRPAEGAGEYRYWTQTPSHVLLLVEPYEGDAQFLVEWAVDRESIPTHRILRVVQGIRDVAGRQKLYRGKPLTNIKVTVIGGSDRVIDGLPVQMAAAMAFQDALSKTELVPIS